MRRPYLVGHGGQVTEGSLYMILCPYMPTGKDDPAIILVQVQMLSVFYYLLFV